KVRTYPFRRFSVLIAAGLDNVPSNFLSGTAMWNRRPLCATTRRIAGKGSWGPMAERNNLVTRAAPSINAFVAAWRAAAPGSTEAMGRCGPMPEHNNWVARAVLIMNAFVAAGRDAELGITELSQRTGLAKSVVSRVLVPLVQGGYVERDPRTPRYRVGLRAFEFGLRYLSRSGAPQSALQMLDGLARETGCTAYLGVLDGPECVVLAAEEGWDRIRVVVSPGERMPAHGTAMGKAIMAHLDERTREALLTEGWPRGLDGQPWRILDPDALREDLAATRVRGYALAID